MASSTFSEIRRIVIEQRFNKSGFKVKDILKWVNQNNHNSNTIRNFIPKHTRVNVVYFERIGKVGSGLYRIRAEYL